MKILHISHSDSQGGAARAAYRIHRALLDSGIESTMWVNSSQSGDWTVSNPSTNFDKVKQQIRNIAARIILKFFLSSNHTLHSPSIMSSNWPKYVNASDADLVNLHWVQDEMLSISDIAKIKKPIVWTLHDMWAFCGSEHYSEDFLWQKGYPSKDRLNGESGFYLNRWRWKKKLQRWKTPFQIIAPSSWLGECVSQSKLMADWPTKVIPNPIDVDTWRPVAKKTARALLKLDESSKLILFGAIGGAEDPRKGFDLLKSALRKLKELPSSQALNIEIVVLGQLKPRTETKLGFKIHYLGHLHDDFSLRNVYSAADIVVVPSRQDNLPNICLEAMSCGTPVVAFKVGGFTDIIEHGINGFLAEPFDVKDLANGMLSILSMKPQQKAKISLSARITAEQKYSPKQISRLYTQVYRELKR